MPFLDVSQLGRGRRVDMGTVQAEGLGSYVDLSVDDGIDYSKSKMKQP